MSENLPDLPPIWLTTAGEYGPLAPPRRAIVLGQIRSLADGRYIVAMEVDPPFSDPRLSPPATDERCVHVSKALGKYSLTVARLSAIFEFDSPFPVVVGRAVDMRALLETGTFDGQQIQMIQRGALFRSEDAAASFAARFRTKVGR